MTIRRGWGAVVVLAVSVLAAAGAGPAIFGMGRRVWTDPLQFNEVDLNSGSYRALSSFTNVQGIVSTHPVAHDLLSNMLYVAFTELTSGGTQHVYSITGVSGELKGNAPLGAPTFFSLYTVRGRLYGFASQQITQYLYRIDPGSGALTRLSTYTNSAGLQSVTYDPVSNRVYAATLYGDYSSNQYLVINATNGALLQRLPRTNDASEMYCAAGSLYAVYAWGGTSRISRINLGSGAGTVIQHLATNFGGINGLTVNHEDKRVYITGTGDSTNTLTVLDATNGTTIARYVLQLDHLFCFANPWVTTPDIREGPTVYWNSLSGHVYRVQGITNGFGPAWANVSASLTGTGGRVNFTDSSVPPTRTYRVMSLGAP